MRFGPLNKIQRVIAKKGGGKFGVFVIAKDLDGNVDFMRWNYFAGLW